MPKSPEIKAALGRGLAFLDKQQEADGSFVSFSSASTQPFQSLRSWQTTFVPALMLASLAGIQESLALHIRERLAGFLLKQKDANEAFNYWAKDAPEYQTMPYPNDLDDTFCALAALYLHDPALIDEAVLAKVIKLLLATETTVGGPYRTWLVPPDSQPIWLDIDVAVNSNIAYFLSLTGSTLPKLDEVMGRAILSDTFSSPYYPSVYAFIYYFARAYGGPHKAQLLLKARQLQAAASTDLDRALCLSARLQLDETQDLKNAANELIAAQQRDGSWPAAVFYADPVKNGQLYYNGGAALTTAFVLEALQLYSQKLQPRATSGKRTAKQHHIAPGAVLSLAKQQCRSLPDDLRRTTLQALAKLAGSDNATEIIGLPEHFNRSLLKPLRPVSDSFLENLSLANLYGWLAYTIYDDFLDEEGQPGLLPAANVAMRNALQSFLGTLPANQPFQNIVRGVFNTIDGANAWELAFCRFKRQNDIIYIGKLPDYENLSVLAERSLGHTLAPIAILSAQKTTGPPLRQTQRALSSYLIVRQLNDDLHDWQDDLSKGRITYVVARILSGLAIKPGDYNLLQLLPEARTQFWYKTLPDACREMRRYVKFSRQALAQAGIFADTNVISRLLDGIEASIEDSLAQQGQAENFLKHYRQKAVKL
jgi:hypothetical protein